MIYLNSLKFCASYFCVLFFKKILQAHQLLAHRKKRKLLAIFTQLLFCAFHQRENQMCAKLEWIKVDILYPLLSEENFSHFSMISQFGTFLMEIIMERKLSIISTWHDMILCCYMFNLKIYTYGIIHSEACVIFSFRDFSFRDRG